MFYQEDFSLKPQDKVAHIRDYTLQLARRNQRVVRCHRRAGDWRRCRLFFPARRRHGA